MMPDEKRPRKETNKKETNRNHGKYSESNQRRTQKKQASLPQEKQSGKAQEAPRLRARIEEAEGEETGAWPSETLEFGEILTVRAWAIKPG